MPGIHVRDLTDDTVRALKRRARAHHRSVQGEVRAILVEAARATHPELEPSRALEGRSLPPVRLIHGRHDQLIPFTETLALERHLLRRADVEATVTDLLAHSRGSGASLARLPAAMRFLAAIRGVIALHGR